jgi:hypothetical protein
LLKLEFIEKLREIALRSPKSQEEMKTLEGECIQLMKQITDFGFANTCPDMVWHYLTDVDIRYTDPEYAKYQNPLFIAALDVWAKTNAT